jgi:hypothetical protein
MSPIPNYIEPSIPIMYADDVTLIINAEEPQALQKSLTNLND